MGRRDNRDLATGAVFILTGLGAAIWAATHLQLGSFARIGPGMFPVCVGIALAVFGAAILLPALRRAGELPAADLRPAAAVLAAVAVFAATVRLFGLVPASVGLTFVALLADGRPRPIPALVLAAILSFLAWAIFVRGLGVQLDAVRWPF